MVKLQESKGRFFVTVPKEFVLLKGWGKGTVLVLTLNGKSNIEIIEGRPSDAAPSKFVRG